MSAPEPVAAVAAVPSHEEIAVLAGAVQEGDLSPAQCARLARLVDQVGTSARLAARLAGRHRDPLWEPVLAAFAELVAEVSR